MEALSKILGEEDEVDLTPMIDVTFLLLIYFMVTTMLKQPEAELSIQLPGKPQSSDITPMDMLNVKIGDTGEVYLNGSEIEDGLDFEMPDFSLPTDFSGAFLGRLESMGAGISQLIPIVKVAPRCPREAQMKGINGSVKMLLNVNSSGKVDKISIQSFKPSRVFNAEAIKAVKRWQFKPKTIDGIAVDQKGELVVEFSCNV